MWSLGKVWPGGFILPKVTIWSIFSISMGETVNTGRTQGSDVVSGVGDEEGVGVIIWEEGGIEDGGGVVINDGDGSIDGMLGFTVGEATVDSDVVSDLEQPPATRSPIIKRMIIVLTIYIRSFRLIRYSFSQLKAASAAARLFC